MSLQHRAVQIVRNTSLHDACAVLVVFESERVGARHIPASWPTADNALHDAITFATDFADCRLTGIPVESFDHFADRDAFTLASFYCQCGTFATRVGATAPASVGTNAYTFDAVGFVR